MKINWTARIKNPVFWMTLIPAIATCVYTVLGCFDIIPPISEDALINAVMAIITALTTLGVFVDPTTAGVGDSERAMSYVKPN